MVFSYFKYKCKQVFFRIRKEIMNFAIISQSDVIVINFQLKSHFVIISTA